jgi:23S rRNA (cytosine1962-C5)-methyltransferase|tara:strand:- start:11057 stop:11935 length:879 start_codon:yes stop_codon:yes gene_type:complete
MTADPEAPELKTLIAEPHEAYTLLDSGDGRKLERYGPYRFIRPEPQAMWRPATKDWQADGEFLPAADADGGGRWHLADGVPESWPLGRGNVRFHAANTPFRHLAFFPDMAPQWDWMASRTGANDEVMNLFGYTGLGSLILADRGAKVTHVDASKKAVAAARDNQALSGMQDRPIRWLVEDALKYAEREVRRGRRYDGIVLDPPKFGRGPKGERWELTETLPELLRTLADLLDENSKYLVLTAYAVRMSALSLGILMKEVLPHGRIEMGEMTVREQARGLLLPTAIFARWMPA